MFTAPQLGRRRVVTHCSECGLTVYITQDTVWQSRGRIGITHVDCCTDPEATPIATGAVTITYPDP